MSFEEYYEQWKEGQESRNNITYSYNTTKNTTNTNTTSVESNEFVWLKFDGNEYWFTKSEIFLGLGIFIFCIISMFLLYRTFLFRKLKKQQYNHVKNDKKSKEIFLCVVLYIVLFVLVCVFSYVTAHNILTMLIPNIVLTAIIYNFIPCILKFILKKEFDIKQARIISIVNAIIVYVFFRVLELYLFGTMNFRNYAFILWGYVSYRILLHKNNYKKT